MSNISAFEWTHSNLSIADGQYNLTFFVNDSYDNSASFVGYIFTIDSTAGDISAPVITISSPVNSTYYTNSSVLFNITTDESLSWAGFTNNSNILINLDNVSTTNWNATIILAEGQHNITLYANDSSSNKNQANKSVVIYIDLNNPQGVSFSCQDANDSAEVNCSYSVSDSLGLSYIKIGFNATGVWQNSSQIALSGESATGSYLIGAGNTTPGVFASQLYIFDLSGRMNDSLADTFSILDDSYPTIWNITYSPNTTASLDPDVQVNVNATIVEDYKISAVSLMWQNLSDGNWISVEMTNNSAIANGSLANTVYNASFLPGNGTYSIKINATDLAGNINLSNNITFVVANETSFWNGTTIPSIKSFTYNQRSGNNTLGVIYLNNTGDEALEFNISIEADSSILSKFDINYTLDNNATYTLNPGENISLNFLVNTTGLTARLDSYNITLISGIGTTIYEKDLYIQSAEAAYLQISVDTYSSSVTTSQSGITYVVSVSNLGTQDASDVVLTWTLPSIFSLASGNLTRSFSNIPIGGSGTNTITVNVNSDTTNTTYYINASASAGNADSVNTSKAITVSDPITITNTVTINTGGGGGGGLSVAGGGGGAIVYSKIIEMNRGQTDRFNIEVFNKNYNSSLEALTMNLTGFLGKYFEIVPKKINFIGPRQSANFTVILKVPEYKDYEEHTLMAVIEGMKVNSASFNESYFEIQNIKLVIQEISRQNVTFSLDEAIRAIEEMKNKGFNVEEVSNILEEAKIKLNASMNKRAWDLAQQIISIRNRAFEVSDLMDRITQALEDPKLTGLITANVVSEVVDENNNTVSVSSLITGNAIFGSKSAEEVLALAKAAFERGDYDTALQRAKSAQVLLLLERKGNFGLFLYLYWHYLLLAMIILTLLGLVASRQYKKVSLTRRISEFDGSEENIRLLILDLQKKYFSGKISSQEYHNIMAKYHDDIAKIRKDRISLRNTRLKTFSREQISQDVKTERVQTEQEIKKLQTQFYVNKKISEKEYEPQSQMLNERLAEIEDEETTSSLMNRADEKKEEKKEKKESRLFKVLSWPARAIRGILERRREKRERFIRDKIKNMGVK